MDHIDDDLPPSSPLASSAVTTGILGTILFTGIFLPRFALTLGDHELSLVLVVTIAGIMALAIGNLVHVSGTRIVLFSVMAVAVLMSMMLGGGLRASAASLLNLLLLYACYVFVVPSDATLGVVIRLFRRFMLIVAILAVVQFAAQFVVPGPTLFTFDGALPAEILTHGFNTVIPVSDGGALNKSNGFFLVEPSTLSQFVTLAIVVELEFFRPSWRLAVLGLALGLSFSGTGMVLFAAIVPAWLLWRGRGGLMILAVPILILALVFAGNLGLTTLLDRVGEFSADNTSGFARFLSPFYLFNDYLFPHMDTTLFGEGPGSIELFFKKTAYLIHDPTWGKLIFEYGFVGALPFLAFVSYCFFSGARSKWLSAALFVNYLTLAGNLLDVRLHAIILVLAVMQNRPRELRVETRPTAPPHPMGVGFHGF